MKLLGRGGERNEMENLFCHRILFVTCCVISSILFWMHLHTIRHQIQQRFIEHDIIPLKVWNINNAPTTTMKSEYSIEIKTDSPYRKLCPTYNNSHIILCQVLYGRLGNNMFIYASNYCLRKQYGFRLPIPEFLEIYRIFNLTAEPIDFWKLKDMCKEAEHHIGHFDGRIIYENFNISCTRNFVVNGLLQSYVNFLDCAEDIRQEFVFREDLTEKAERAISDSIGQIFHFDLTSRNFYIVAIHVRLGDYVSSRMAFPVANKRFYDRARDYYRTRYQSPKFIILTTPENETVNWCMENLVYNTSDTYLVPDGPIEVHMYILANTDHVIISSGTFGWWGAWLNRNATVVKWNVLYNGTFWDPFDFYPSKWILLEGEGLGNYIDSKEWLSQ